MSRNYIRKYFCDWDAEIEEYLVSNMRFREFCMGKEYTVGAFCYHYYKKMKTKEKEEPEVFLPVVIPSGTAGNNAIIVNGYEIVITEDTDKGALQKLLEAIGGLRWN